MQQYRAGRKYAYPAVRSALREDLLPAQWDRAASSARNFSRASDASVAMKGAVAGDAGGSVRGGRALPGRPAGRQKLQPQIETAGPESGKRGLYPADGMVARSVA